MSVADANVSRPGWSPGRVPFTHPHLPGSVLLVEVLRERMRCGAHRFAILLAEMLLSPLPPLSARENERGDAVVLAWDVPKCADIR